MAKNNNFFAFTNPVSKWCPLWSSTVNWWRIRIIINYLICFWYESTHLACSYSFKKIPTLLDYLRVLFIHFSIGFMFMSRFGSYLSKFITRTNYNYFVWVDLNFTFFSITWTKPMFGFPVANPKREFSFPGCKPKRESIVKILKLNDKYIKIKSLNK